MSVLVEFLVMTVFVAENESVDVLFDRQFQVIMLLLIILVRTTQQLLFQCFVFSNKFVIFPSQLRNFCLSVLCLRLVCCVCSWCAVSAASVLCLRLVCCVCGWCAVSVAGVLCLRLVCCVCGWCAVSATGVLPFEICWSGCCYWRSQSCFPYDIGAAKEDVMDNSLLSGEWETGSWYDLLHTCTFLNICWHSF